MDKMDKLEVRRLALEMASKHCPGSFDARDLIEQAKVIENYILGTMSLAAVPSHINEYKRVPVSAVGDTPSTDWKSQ